MIALDVLALYIQQHPYGLTDGTVSQLRYTMGAYCRFSESCGLDVFSCEFANRWIDTMRRDKAPDTVRTQRTNLLCVWWWAYREHYVNEPPLRLRRLRPTKRQPEAWTLHEVHTLLATAEADQRRPLFWGSLVRSGYDTGLRLGDLLTMPISHVAAVIQMRQHKTGFPVAVQLRPDTLDAIRRQTTGRDTTDLVWPLWGRREALYRAFRHLVASSGIRPGTFRWLRRSAATQVETIQPGAGTALLGHASRSTTEQWYLDRSQLAHPPLPPW